MADVILPDPWNKLMRNDLARFSRTTSIYLFIFFICFFPRRRSKFCTSHRIHSRKSWHSMEDCVLAMCRRISEIILLRIWCSRFPACTIASVWRFSVTRCPPTTEPPSDRKSLANPNTSSTYQRLVFVSLITKILWTGIFEATWK